MKSRPVITEKHMNDKGHPKQTAGLWKWRREDETSSKTQEVNPARLKRHRRFYLVLLRLLVPAGRPAGVSDGGVRFTHHSECLLCRELLSAHRGRRRQHDPVGFKQGTMRRLGWGRKGMRGDPARHLARFPVHRQSGAKAFRLLRTEGCQTFFGFEMMHLLDPDEIKFKRVWVFLPKGKKINHNHNSKNVHLNWNRLIFH